MLKTSLKIAALSAVSLTLLSACGAASKLEDAADRAQDELDNAADRAENERERLARLTPPASPTAAVADRVTSVRVLGPYSNAGTFDRDGEGNVSDAEYERRYLDDSYDLKVSETQDTFTLVQSGSNLVMTVNGTAYTFTPRETSPAVRDPNDNSIITTPAGYRWDTTTDGDLEDGGAYDLRAVLNGTHSTIHGTHVFYNTSPRTDRPFNDTFDYTRGFATIGQRTPTSVVESQTATATYTGYLSLNVESSATKTAGIDNYTDSVTGSSTEYLSGGDGLTMTVDFTANTIAGEAKYSITLIGESEPIDGREATITFNSAPIVGNGFAGTFTMNNDYRSVEGITNNPTGNYAGNFFGPAADDIAGVMRFDAQGGAIGVGGFRADRNAQ